MNTAHQEQLIQLGIPTAAVPRVDRIRCRLLQPKFSTMMWMISSIVALGSVDVVDLATATGTTTGTFTVHTSGDCSSSSNVATVTWDTTTAW